jgi:hypothetical protein
MIDIYYYFCCVKTDFVTLEGVGMEGRQTMNMPIALSIEPVFYFWKPWWLISMLLWK